MRPKAAHVAECAPGQIRATGVPVGPPDNREQHDDAINRDDPADAAGSADARDAASAQQRTFYGAGGKVFGRSTTDSSGAVTNYDSRGRVISRETTSGNQTTIYDTRGRNVGRFTTNR
jgi:YD repeat-containing protein